MSWLSRTAACSLLALTLLLFGCRNPNASDPFVDPVDTLNAGVDLVVHPPELHPLTPRVEVTTTAPVELEVRFWSDSTPVRCTDRSPAGTLHQFTLVGLRAETVYSVQAVAHGPEGDIARSPVRTVTTGPLPDGLAALAVDVSEPDRVQPGFTLFGPSVSEVYGVAVDEEGEIVWSFTGTTGYDFDTNIRDLTLLPDGNLLTLLQHYVQVVAPDGTPVLTVPNETGYVFNQHEMVATPNGTFLTVWQENREVDGVLLRGNGLVELDADGQVVWTWDAFEHLDTERFPGEESRTELTSGALDWLHANAAVYLADEHAALFSVRNQDWILKIDMTTGELLWRLGPDGDFTLTSGEWFYSPHAPAIAPDGSLLIYDNGNDRPGEDRYSRAVRYLLDEDAMTATETWSFETEAYTGHYGSVQALPNGNVLVGAGGPNVAAVEPTLYEVTEAGDVVWQLETVRLDEDNKHQIYRARRIEDFYPSGGG